MVHEVETLAYVKANGVPWHGLGTPLDDPPTSADAIRAAGLEWRVEKRPLFVEIGGEYQRTQWYALVRDTDGAVLGCVDEPYRPISNAEAFEIVDSVFQEFGVEVRYETAGSLKGGRKVFLLARIPEDIVIGMTRYGAPDVQHPYLLLWTGHDGNTAISIYPTMVRVVCWNTLMMAERQAGRERVTFKHVYEPEYIAKQARRTLGVALRSMERFREVAPAMAEVNATPELVRVVEDILIPPPVTDGVEWFTYHPEVRPMYVPPERYQHYIENVRPERLDIFRSVLAEEQPTLWGLFNAATGYLDQARPWVRVKGEQRFNAALFGTMPQKKKVFNLLATAATL